MLKKYQFFKSPNIKVVQSFEFDMKIAKNSRFGIFPYFLAIYWVFFLNSWSMSKQSGFFVNFAENWLLPNFTSRFINSKVFLFVPYSGFASIYSVWRSPKKSSFYDIKLIMEFWNSKQYWNRNISLHLRKINFFCYFQTLPKIWIWLSRSGIRQIFYSSK